ncbi:MAG: ABC transporter permease [Deltaproteobacteria bacterium]|nr:ABC transporter permease [Deltaproteobacteria bacterium]
MPLYFLKRLMTLVPTMFVVVTLVFFLLRLIPGDPVDFILGENALPSARQELVKTYRFDRPVFEQYCLYLQNLFKGNLGRSYFSEKPVNAKIRQRYGATLQLAFASVLWAVVLSLPLGVLSAVKKNTLFDRLTLVFSLVGVSLPSFYLGPLLALLFSIHLDWFPLSGSDLPGSLFLPSITLGLGMAALLTRMTRASLIEVLSRDYIRTAMAKGLSPFKVVVKHALRTALIPLIAVLGLQFGTLLAGTVITEKIFSWPGLGSLMLESINQRDYALVQGCVLLIAFTYVVVNLLTDFFYMLVDPRLRLIKDQQ